MILPADAVVDGQRLEEIHCPACCPTSTATEVAVQKYAVTIVEVHTFRFTVEAEHSFEAGETAEVEIEVNGTLPVERQKSMHIALTTEGEEDGNGS